MKSETIKETTVLISDLEMIRTSLMAVMSYLQAGDIGKSQLNMLDPVRYSPLTQDLGVTLERVNGILGDFLLEKYNAEREEEGAEDNESTEEE